MEAAIKGTSDYIRYTGDHVGAVRAFQVVIIPTGDEALIASLRETLLKKFDESEQWHKDPTWTRQLASLRAHLLSA